VGFLEMGCLPKVLELKKEPLQGLVLEEHALIEALLNCMLRIDIGTP
jgi:hypothetical protein